MSFSAAVARSRPCRPSARAVVEGLVARAIAASVDGVLERARRDPLVAAALESVYGSRILPAPATAGAD